MIRIGIICPSEIAYRRFMPALSKISSFQFAGIGICSKQERFGMEENDAEKIEAVLCQERDKAKKFIDEYGGKIFDSYTEIVESDEIDAIYIPLPPALHYPWAKKALENNLHVLLEKPSTTNTADTKELVRLAGQKKKALHENYMFAFHNQLKEIAQIIERGEIGDVRLYRISFGFPQRAVNDFRYNKELGGGALIDAGGYTIKYAAMLLGETAHITAAQMNYTDEFEVDIYGSATLVNQDGATAQIAFGMDNSYKCELEVWGSKGCLTTGRVLTAPAGFVPEAALKTANGTVNRKLSADDTFLKSIMKFEQCIQDDAMREENYKNILKQAELVDEFRRTAGNII